MLKLTVCTDAESHGMVFAPVEWTNDLYTGYDMTVLGVCFTMIPGVPPGANRNIASHRDWRNREMTTPLPESLSISEEHEHCHELCQDFKNTDIPIEMSVRIPILRAR